MPHRTKWSVCPTQVRIAGVKWFEIGRCGTSFDIGEFEDSERSTLVAPLRRGKPGEPTLMARSPVNVKSVTTLLPLGA